MIPEDICIEIRRPGAGQLFGPPSYGAAVRVTHLPTGLQGKGDATSAMQARYEAFIDLMRALPVDLLEGFCQMTGMLIEGVEELERRDNG